MNRPEDTPVPPPSALLLIAPGCPHCPAVLEGLGGLIKKGKLARLEVVNLVASPEIGQELGVRSVPWTRIGPFELEGAQTPAELAHWADRATQGHGLGEYYVHLLEHRRLDQVSARIDSAPDTVTDLLGLLDTTDVPMAALIGVGAVMEDLAPEHAAWEFALPALEHLTQSDRPQTRADASHYLGFSGRHEAAKTLERMLQDNDKEVREIAAESLAMLKAEAPASD